MTCLVCYTAEVVQTCADCGSSLTACDECASDMGENYCPTCDMMTEPGG